MRLLSVSGQQRPERPGDQGTRGPGNTGSQELQEQGKWVRETEIVPGPRFLTCQSSQWTFLGGWAG